MNLPTSFSAPIKLIFILLLAALIAFGFPKNVSANLSQTGISHYLNLDETEVFDGAIVVLVNDAYKLSTEPYTHKPIGVINSNPPLAFDYTDNDTSTSVVVSGVTKVAVSNQNGDIKTGDYITTSSQSGIGMKATEPGYVLGIALQNFSPPTDDPLGLIDVSLEIDFSYNPNAQPTTTNERFSGNLKDIFTLSSVAVYESPTKVFRYLMAAIIMLSCLAFAFLSFTRTASKGARSKIKISLIGAEKDVGRFIVFLEVVLLLGWCFFSTMSIAFVC